MFSLIDFENDYEYAEKFDSLDEAIDNAERHIIDDDFKTNIDIVNQDYDLIATSRLIAPLFHAIKIDPPVIYN